MLVLLVAGLPVTFPFVLGYGMSALRAARAQAAAPPPPVVLTTAAAWTGLKAAAGFVMLSAPFAAGAAVVARSLAAGRGREPLDQVVTVLEAAGVAAFPWGAAMLLVLLPNLGRFGRDGRLRSLVDPAAAGRVVRARFIAWNVAGAAVVTAWALALASTLACGVGGLLGAAYAILVTAHAAAAIDTES